MSRGALEMGAENSDPGTRCGGPRDCCLPNRRGGNASCEIVRCQKKSERRAAVRTGLQRYGTRGQCARLWYLAGLGLSVETIMSDERQAGRPETRSAVRSRGCLPEKSCVRYYDAGDDLGHNRSWATSLGIKILRSRNADQFRLEIYSCLAVGVSPHGEYFGK